MANKIIFFDSECVLCNRYAQFIIRNDPSALLKFAPLKGETYKTLNLERLAPQVDSILFYQAGKLSQKTEAIVGIGKNLAGFYPFLSQLISLIPYLFSNLLYDLIAKIRNKIFGKVEQCALLSAKERERLLP